MLWEPGGRFSQRHAGTGSSQLAAGEVTATLLGGCAHSKRSGRGARLLLPGPEHRKLTRTLLKKPLMNLGVPAPRRLQSRVSINTVQRDLEAYLGDRGQAMLRCIKLLRSSQATPHAGIHAHHTGTRASSSSPERDRERAHIRCRHTRIHDCARAGRFGSLAWDLVFGAPSPGSEEWHRQLSRAQLGCTVV